MSTKLTILRCRTFLIGFCASLFAVNAFAAASVALDAAATRDNNGTTSGPLTTSSDKTVYLRFRADGITASRSVITKATLRLYRTSGSGATTIRAANNSRSDSDSALWWNTADSLDIKPPHLAASALIPLDTTIGSGSNTWDEFVITGQYITGDGLYSFALTSVDENTYAPKSNVNAPQLVIETSIKLNKATYKAIELLEQAPRIADRFDMAASGVVNMSSYYYKYGVIDATKQPYGAKANDSNDDRLAIQRAVNDARLARAVVYLPQGTYQVSDTIEMVQGAIDKDNVDGRTVNPTERGYMIGHDSSAQEYDGSDPYLEKWINAREFGNALIGKPNARALLQLKLAAGDVSFDSPNSPKPVLRIWSRWNLQRDLNDDGDTLDTGETAAETDTDSNRSAVNYNQTVSNIDINLNDTNQSHTGAVGIMTGTAQGGVISDCMITATNGFAGIYGSAGPGGGIHDVVLTGGQYGLYVSKPGEGQQCLLSACTFTDQTVKAVYWTGLGGLTLVGANITGKGIQVISSPTAPWNGMLCLVDSKIDLTGTNQKAVESDRSVYMNRVYVKNGNPVITPDPNLPAPPNAILSSSNWILFNEYAGGVSINQNPFDGDSTAIGVPYYTGGTGAMVKTDTATLVDSVNVGSGVDFHDKHRWLDTPWFEASNSGVISVTNPAYGAKGDGMTDDTDAIQDAIDYAATNGKDVFLPKGDYRISQSLHLKGAVKLFGIHKNYTSIQSMYSDRVVTGDFYDTAATAKPLLIADVGATGMLSDLSLVQRITDAKSYLLNWKAGPASVVKNVTFLRRPMVADAEDTESAMILIDGAGTGGRFYHLWGVASSQKEPNTPARHLKVGNTTGKLAFYMMNFEYAHNLPQVEINGAQNVDIYQAKFEGNYRNLHVKNSANIRVFGVGGNASPFPSNVDSFVSESEPYFGYKYANQNILVEGSSNYLVAGQSYQLRKPDPETGYEAQTGDIAANSAMYKTSVGASSDPAKFDRLKENYSGNVEKAPGAEQFVLFKRGNPPPLFVP